MNEFQDTIFLDEIVLQSKIAQRAFKRLEANYLTRDKVEVWCSIQSILGAAGNVSKILWPVKKYSARGARLRKLLNVNQDNFLADRQFRNDFEHYDERIEEWFEIRSGGVYVDLAMNPSLNDPTSNSHRGFNAFDNTLLFRGRLLDLTKVLKALSDIEYSCKPHALSKFY